MAQRHPNPETCPGSRRAVLIGVWAVFAVLVAACGPPSKGVAASPKPRINRGLTITCMPDSADVYVNDKYMGNVAGLRSRPLALPAGTHRIELRLEGYFSHFAEVTVARGVQQKLDVTLRKEPF